jgi:hypothetical protein
VDIIPFYNSSGNFDDNKTKFNNFLIAQMSFSLACFSISLLILSSLDALPPIKDLIDSMISFVVTEKSNSLKTFLGS